MNIFFLKLLLILNRDGCSILSLRPAKVKLIERKTNFVNFFHIVELFGVVSVTRISGISRGKYSWNIFL